MHSEPENTEEEPLPILWGLDPIFSAFAKLYIKDILELQESYRVPGIFFYKTHPVTKVDILGTVVHKREREDFFSYGVDDSTGVINCVCWKNTFWKEYTKPSTSNISYPTTAAFNVADQMRKLQQVVQRQSCLEIGDVIRVRGHIKNSRQQREIIACTYYKVEDPTFAHQISWMLEVPQLYRHFYDKPFQNAFISSDKKEYLSLTGLVGQLTEKLKEFLQETKVHTFSLKDLETVESLVKLASLPVNPQNTAAGGLVSKQVHSLFRQAVQMLQESGLVFQKFCFPEEIFQVTEQDKELCKLTKQIIKEDSKKEKYAEKGCHFNHIFSCVRQSYNSNISEAAMQQVLSILECESEVIRTTDNHYASF
ncbi:CST complex subunit STN1 [Erpetoichthys calabaricus]|uniref:CST complex subunit STN1 n=1 Tax=Erpetoichthys calabaricus TaxID=27687 RepID=UPI002234A89E|nr:CST complex subunit STN1 [Erpetoichthys calabaricus]